MEPVLQDKDFLRIVEDTRKQYEEFAAWPEDHGGDKLPYGFVELTKRYIGGQVSNARIFARNSVVLTEYQREQLEAFANEMELILEDTLKLEVSKSLYDRIAYHAARLGISLP